MNRSISQSKIRDVLIAFSLVLLVSSCTDSNQADNATSGQNASSTQNAAGVAPVTIAPTTATGMPGAKRGVVKSSTLGGGYSYIEVDVQGDTFWLATAVTSVSPGDTIQWNDHALMSNFTSKSLNRTFDRILFVDRLIDPSQATAAFSSGVVEEAVTGAGYSFIRVDAGGTSIWLAAPEVVLEVGQSIGWSGGTTMRNFTSRTLNRTFDQIIFVNAVQAS